MFVCVHIGAGIHSPLREDIYKKLCKEKKFSTNFRSCLRGFELLSKGFESTYAALKACEILENSPYTNAGLTSNKTIDNKIECDASIMSSKYSKGASVGVLENTQNPIKVAYKLLENSKNSHLSEKVSPLFLAGKGAYDFAKSHNLISDLNEDENEIKKNQKKKNINKTEINNEINDTVGVICVDKCLNIAVASSSGGVPNCVSGRIGPAALIGPGIWCNNISAICTTGIGEDIIALSLASRLAESLKQSDNDPVQIVESFFNNNVFENPCLQFKYPLLGVLGIKLNVEQKFVELIFAHTTESMGIGYMSVNEKIPTSFISRRKNNRIKIVLEMKKI